MVVGSGGFREYCGRGGEGGVRLLLKVRIIHKKFFVSSQPDLTTGFNVKTI